MDNRFKSIGGMFQGVRGSTDKGGASKYAAHLVKLDAGGLIDKSCLPENVREAADVSDRLDAEIEAREEGDLDIIGRQETYEAAAKARLDGVDGILDGLRHDLDLEIARQEEDSAVFRAEIKSLDDGLTAASGKITEHSESIGSLESRMTTLESDVSDVKSDLSSADSRIDLTTTRVSTLESLVSTIQTQVSSIGVDVSGYVTQITQLQTGLAALKSDEEQFKTETREALSAIRRDISSLQTMVDVIYEKLVNLVPDQP